MDDIGSVAEIEKWAKKEGAEIHYLELQSQFRCNGSDGYLAWLDNVLDIRETANYDLEGIDYVVVHELCHRKEMNHSKAFWSEVDLRYAFWQGL